MRTLTPASTTRDAPGSAPEVRPRRGRRWDQRLVLGGALIGLFAITGLLAPVIAPFNPVKQDYRRMLASPGWPYLLGTDEFGRDILSRLLHGSRISLTVAGGAVVIAAAIGIPVGVAAGYYGRLVDVILMRLTDLFMAFPPILLALAMVAFFGPSVGNLIIVIGLVYFPRFARLSYVTTLTVKASLFVEASRAIGAGDLRILARGILPNILAPLLVEASLAVGFGILLESGLSFLGLGVQPPAPSWGLMVADARNVMAQSPSYIIWPSLAVATTILAFNIAGDGLRDVLDPRLRS